MNLVILYGAPAVGKLAVARELSRQTGLKLLHSHLTIDVARAVFDHGSPSFYRVLHDMRLVVYREAVVQNIDLALTVAYHKSEANEASARETIDELEALGARVCLVHLTCTREALEERVTAVERVEMGKLASVETLRGFIKDKDYETDYPSPNTLRIDNTNVSPEDAAMRIVEHYGLPVV